MKKFSFLKMLSIGMVVCFGLCSCASTEIESGKGGGSEESSSNINQKSDADFMLIQAASQGHLDEVKRLVASGADVNAKDKKGVTALMIASLSNHRDIVEYLVEHGADLNDENGFTPLIFAITGEHQDIVEYLVEHGADINVKSDMGYTPLMYAACYRQPNIVRYLVEHGAKVNEKGIVGETALLLAGDNKEIAEYLIKHGADVSSRDMDRVASLVAEKIRKKQKAVKYFVEHKMKKRRRH